MLIIHPYITYSYVVVQYILIRRYKIYTHLREYKQYTHKIYCDVYTGRYMNSVYHLTHIRSTFIGQNTRVIKAHI